MAPAEPYGPRWWLKLNEETSRQMARDR
ncbi:hypothetical protein SMG44B_60186 [Stenotrophomonas maltophilia]|nr:hypothetical protein BN1263300016 [Stenotrophomonas maltophilia]